MRPMKWKHLQKTSRYEKMWQLKKLERYSDKEATIIFTKQLV